MQRYLVRRIHREVEFKIVETDGTEHVGFITGFDDKCLQLSTSPAHEADEPRSMVIFWPIRRIEETGQLVDYLDHNNRQAIRRYSHALRAQCEAHLNGSKVRKRPASEDKQVPAHNGAGPAFYDPLQ